MITAHLRLAHSAFDWRAFMAPAWSDPLDDLWLPMQGCLCGLTGPVSIIT